MPELEFLGFTINREGIKPSYEKIKAIKEMPVPKDKKAVKRFLGMGSYYRKFIKDFAKRTHRLRELTKDSVKFEWNEQAQSELDDIKDCLTSDIVMTFPDWNKEFILATDASIKGFGAVLSQKDEREREKVIEYASKSCTAAEARYGISQLEGAAAMWAIEKFALYLRNGRFRLITDHKALTRIKNVKDNNAMLHRWSLKLAEYDYEVEYKKGERHTNADCPSRDPITLIIEGENDLVLNISQQDLEIAILEGLLDDESIKNVLKKLTKVGTITLNIDTKEVEEIELRYNDWEAWIWKSPYLYHRMYKRRRTVDRLYIPEGETRVLILQEMHDIAHLGFKRCYEKVKERFYWRNMYRDTYIYCLSCDKCQRRGKPPRNKGGKMGRILTTQRNELIGMDIFSGLPESKRGYKHVLVMTDHMTKYVVTTPLKTKTEAEVARALIHNWGLRLGWPKRIQTDQGGEFTGNVIKEFYKIMSIEKLSTTPYHPQSNGQCE
jgi:hypothetical protein